MKPLVHISPSFVADVVANHINRIISGCEYSKQKFYVSRKSVSLLLLDKELVQTYISPSFVADVMIL